MRDPENTETTRLQALRSAAVYYVLRHMQLIWTASRGFWVGRLFSDFSADLPLNPPVNDLGGDDLFEYLHTRGRSDAVTFARFFSYIAPYWFWGVSGPAIRSLSARLETLHELINVLEGPNALTPAILTECVLCVGVATCLPPHPDDSIRVKKGYGRWSVREQWN